MRLIKGFIIPILLLALLPFPAFANHTFNADPPTCDAIYFTDTSNNILTSGSSTIGSTIKVRVSAGDILSGVSSIALMLNNNISPIQTSTTSPLIYNWTPTAVDQYNFTASIINGVGNRATSTALCINSVSYNITSATGAWIQVTGDVHSNGDINANGGP